MPEQHSDQLQGSPFLSTIMKIDPKFMDHVKRTEDMVYADGAVPRKMKLLFAMAFDASHGAVNGVRSLAQSAVRAGATQEEIREIRKRCEAVLKKIGGGDDFGEMALLYSQDVSNRSRGDLGYFRKGELLPIVEREALRLKVGEVSGVVRTEFGFHIIKLLDRKGVDPLPFEEVKAKVKADYYDVELDKALKQFISTLRDKSIIEIKL